MAYNNDTLNLNATNPQPAQPQPQIQNGVQLNQAQTPHLQAPKAEAKPEDKPKKVEFDYQGARDAGATDADIASHMAEKTGFNLQKAKQAGASDLDVIKFLAPKADVTQKTQRQRQIEDASNKVGKAVKGVAQEAVSIASHVAAPIAGLVAGAGQAEANAVGLGNGKRASDTFEDVQKSLSYEPTSKEGRKLAAVANYVPEHVDAIAKKVGQGVLDKTKSPALAAAADTAINAIPMVIGPKSIKIGGTEVSEMAGTLAYKGKDMLQKQLEVDSPEMIGQHLDTLAGVFKNTKFSDLATEMRNKSPDEIRADLRDPDSKLFKAQEGAMKDVASRNGYVAKTAVENVLAALRNNKMTPIQGAMHVAGATASEAVQGFVAGGQKGAVGGALKMSGHTWARKMVDHADAAAGTKASPVAKEVAAYGLQALAGHLLPHVAMAEMGGAVIGGLYQGVKTGLKRAKEEGLTALDEARKSVTLGQVTSERPVRPQQSSLRDALSTQTPGESAGQIALGSGMTQQQKQQRKDQMVNPNQ
jgi:hypothetical protein